MGLASELSYTHHRANPFQRAMQAFGSTRTGAWFFSKTLAPIDRLLHRATKGRMTLPAVLAGLPVIMVTTTGRKSGLPRTTPLISVPIGDDLTLLGTNFGQTSTPSWVFNLEADPRATVEYHGVERPVVARPATDVERDHVWKASAGVYGGYEKYQQRISGREVRVFVLEPAGADGGGETGGASGAEPT